MGTCTRAAAGLHVGGRHRVRLRRHGVFEPVRGRVGGPGHLRGRRLRRAGGDVHVRATVLHEGDAVLRAPRAGRGRGNRHVHVPGAAGRVRDGADVRVSVGCVVRQLLAVGGGRPDHCVPSVARRGVRQFSEAARTDAPRTRGAVRGRLRARRARTSVACGMLSTRACDRFFRCGLVVGVGALLLAACSGDGGGDTGGGGRGGAVVGRREHRVEVVRAAARRARAVARRARRAAGGVARRRGRRRGGRSRRRGGWRGRRGGRGRRRGGRGAAARRVRRAARRVRRRRGGRGRRRGGWGGAGRRGWRHRGRGRRRRPARQGAAARGGGGGTAAPAALRRRPDLHAGDVLRLGGQSLRRLWRSPGCASTRPQGCTAVVDRVCGCDGQIHSNPCIAASSGVDINEQGGCTPPSGTFALRPAVLHPGHAVLRAHDRRPCRRARNIRLPHASAGLRLAGDVRLPVGNHLRELHDDRQRRSHHRRACFPSLARAPRQPFTHTICFSSATISTRSCCCAITRSMFL